MASFEVTITIPASQQAWPERIRELVCRFLTGVDAPSVGTITITPPSDPMAGTCTATVECLDSAGAATITSGINAMTQPWYGMVLSAVQGTDS